MRAEDEKPSARRAGQPTFKTPTARRADEVSVKRAACRQIFVDLTE